MTRSPDVGPHGAGRVLKRPVLMALVALGLGACVSGPSGTNQVLSGASSLATSVAGAGAGAARTVTAAVRAPTVTPASASEPSADVAATPSNVATPSTALAVSRPATSLQGLFNKGQVSGAELLTEIASMRALMKAQRSASAVSGLLGPAPAAAKSTGVDPRAQLLKAAVKSAEESLKPYVASIGFGALDLHLGSMIDDPKLLANETIKLPSSKGMTTPQMQRVINMAAILVATRATGKILKKAQDDFASVEGDYTRLITRREAAAQVLYGVLLQGAPDKTAVPGDYSDADLRYLRENVGRMSVKDFANDLGAQNLALRHLSQTDPAAWNDYKARSDGLRSVTKGYIRTAAGVTAFAALLANFGNETLGAINKDKGADILSALPLAWEFVKEVPPVLRAAWQVGAAGVVELPMKATKRFRVAAAGTSSDLGSASDVFAAVRKGGSEPLFNEALFRTGSDGLLYKLYRCDKSEVGRMLDVAVPMTEREKFGAKVSPGNAARYSFANAFNAPGPEARAQELGDELLRKDHRERTDAVNGVALGEAQRAATKGAVKWNNDQLLRLILANREGLAAHASLQLGDVLVRPVPSMQSVYAYESLIDECSQQLGGGPRSSADASAVSVPAAQTKPTSTATGSKPAVRTPAKPASKSPSN